MSRSPSTNKFTSHDNHTHGKLGHEGMSYNYIQLSMYVLDVVIIVNALGIIVQDVFDSGFSLRVVTSS